MSGHTATMMPPLAILLQAWQQCNGNAAHEWLCLCLVMFWHDNKAKQTPATNSEAKPSMLLLYTSDL